jgi:hypothetical protein
LGENDRTLNDFIIIIIIVVVVTSILEDIYNNILRIGGRICTPKLFEKSTFEISIPAAKNGTYVLDYTQAS